MVLGMGLGCLVSLAGVLRGAAWLFLLCFVGLVLPDLHFRSSFFALWLGIIFGSSTAFV